jgi:hypothetical protein
MRADSDDDESSDDRSSELTPPSFTTRRSLDAGRQNDRHSLQAPPLPRRSGKDRSQVDDAEDPGRETYRRRGTGRPAVRQPTRVREASLVRRTGDASMTQPERRSARRPPAESGWYSP